MIDNALFWLISAQGPEEMFLSLEHQNLSKTSEKMGRFDRATVSLRILLTTNQETEDSQDRLTVLQHTVFAYKFGADFRIPETQMELNEIA